jgi:hypothetical protein
MPRSISVPNVIAHALAVAALAFAALIVAGLGNPSAPHAAVFNSAAGQGTLAASSMLDATTDLEKKD